MVCRWRKVVKSGKKWDMFIGEFNHTVDMKGRVSLPARFRDELSSNFYITKGMEGCLFIYDEREWTAMDEKIKKLRLTSKAARNFSRQFYGQADQVSCDRQGRFLIPPTLRTYAGIQKEVVILGVSNRIEVWAKDQWETYNEQESMDFDELTDKLDDLDVDL